MFPDAIVLVPFRDPWTTWVRCCTQHRNFTAIHQQDPFRAPLHAHNRALRFRRDLRPCDFDGWLGTPGGAGSMTGDFWLRYWCATFQYLLANRVGQLRFLSYERLLRDNRRRRSRRSPT